MEQRVGTCSLCGGDVIGFRGAWWATIPPPTDRCSSCGAVRADQDDTIAMKPQRVQRITRDGWNTTTLTIEHT